MTKGVESIYKTTSFPPGINNVASNCYASSVLQFLFSHLTFRTMITEFFATHSNYCSTCSKIQSDFFLCVSKIIIVIIRPLQIG